MARKSRPRKRYSDPYGRNRPLIAGQVRCSNRRCSIAVWYKTARQYEGKCPGCHDEARIREATKDQEIVL